jgi:methylmalonyl-CoA mutase
MIRDNMRAIEETRGADIKVVGGVIPIQIYDMLREAGVQGIFGSGTNLVDAGGEVLKRLGRNMPPLEEAAE